MMGMQGGAHQANSGSSTSTKSVTEQAHEADAAMGTWGWCRSSSPRVDLLLDVGNLASAAYARRSIARLSRACGSARAWFQVEEIAVRFSSIQPLTSPERDVEIVTNDRGRTTSSRATHQRWSYNRWDLSDLLAGIPAQTKVPIEICTRLEFMYL